MINEENNDDLQNLSELKLLESLNLGSKKIIREESKEDNFESELQNLLSKINTQLDNIRNFANLNNTNYNYSNPIITNLPVKNNNINNYLKNTQDNNNSNYQSLFNANPPLEKTNDYNMLKSKKPEDTDFSKENNNNYAMKNQKESITNLSAFKFSNNYISMNNNNNQEYNNPQDHINHVNDTNFNLLNSFNNQTNVIENNNTNNNNGVIENNFFGIKTSKIKNAESINDDNYIIFKSDNENPNNFTKNNENNNINNVIKEEEKEEEKIGGSNNNHNDDVQKISDNNDFNIDDVPEIDNINDVNNNSNENNIESRNNNNVNNSNENNIISRNNNNDGFNTNIIPEGNFKLDVDEIKMSEDLNEEENNEKKEEEEEKIRKEKEEEEKKRKEEEENIRKKEEEENIRKNDEEQKIRKEEEVISIEDEKSEKKEIKNDNKSKKQKDILKNNNIYDNNEHPVKEKEEKGKDEMNCDKIEEVKSIHNNLPAPESANISEVMQHQGNDNLMNGLKILNENINEENNNDEKKEVEDDSKEKKEEKKEEKENGKTENLKDKGKETNQSYSKKFSQDLRTNSMPQKNPRKMKEIPDGKKIQKAFTQKDIMIKAYIKKREKLDTQPDLSNIEDCITLEKLVQEEKALKDIIPDFNEKILDKEKKENIINREYSLIKTKSLQFDIKEDERLSQKMADLNSHPDLMKNIFETKGLINIKEYKGDIDTIFDEEIEEINCPIGEIENFESFIQRFFLNDNLEIKELFKKYFSNWRKVLGDGNSFYRILMFSIFEAYILSNNLEELKYILSEMTSDEFIKVYEKQKIDYKKCFSIFSIILNFLEKKEKARAYEILLRSYLLKDFSFDKLLIAYIRRVVAIYINELKKVINDTEKCDDNKFNSYLIESTNIEPTFLIFCMIQYLFNISMIFLTLKGELAKPFHNHINFMDQEEENDYPVICFGYFFSSYYKLYHTEFEEKNQFELKLMENNNKQLTYIFKDLKQCKKCDKKTENILFIEKKFILCKNCLEDHLSYACNFRADAFKEGGFLGLEYYTRPIKLCDNYYIDDLEIMELLESLNIINALCQKYNDTICDKCKDKNDDKDYYVFKCGCTFCEECIESFVLSLTGGIKYLNPFELKEFDSVKCLCGKQFDFEDAIKHVKSSQNDMKESSMRLKNYINTLCLLCTKQLRDEDKRSPNQFRSITKYKIIKLKKNMKNERSNNVDYMEIEHLICEPCYKKNFKGKSFDDIDEEENEEDEQDERVMKDKYVDLEKGKIKCEICCRTHDLDPKFSNEGECCSACDIF